MNWGAGVLILLGMTIVVIGVVGSQKSVCQSLTGGDCAWLPGTTPSNPGNTSAPQPSSPSTQTLTQTITPDPGTPSYTGVTTLASINSHLLGA